MQSNPIDNLIFMIYTMAFGVMIHPRYDFSPLTLKNLSLYLIISALVSIAKRHLNPFCIHSIAVFCASGILIRLSLSQLFLSGARKSLLFLKLSIDSFFPIRLEDI